MVAVIRPLTEPTDLAAVNSLFQQIWGTAEVIVHVDLLRAVAYTGGYVVGAYDARADGSQHLVGASFGFLAEYRGERALHSHITGILPGVQHTGLGRAIKDHQRTWAAERGIGWITWTFDPLVRRNAWFNIAVLGAHVAEYVEDFYGDMHDSVNTGAPSDRLVMAWGTGVAPAAPVGADAASPGMIEVATPDDIVVLRRVDPRRAAEWRQLHRRELGARLSEGARVVGFSRDGNYLVAAPA